MSEVERITRLPLNREEWLAMRLDSITSTEVPALFGLSPYMTALELFLRKRDVTSVDIGENSRAKWGNRLEPAIAAGVAEDQGWTIRPMKEFITLPKYRLGASFDFAIDPDEILEIKTVDFIRHRDTWFTNDDGTIEAPFHIEAQIQTQLAVSGRKAAHIAALVGGNEVTLIRREPDLEVIDAIKAKVTEFWERIAKDDPYPPDFSRDGKLISTLYGLDPNKVCDARQSERATTLARLYDEARENEKRAAEVKSACKAELLHLAQDSHKIIGDGFTVSCGISPGGPRSFVVDAFRNFSLRLKKEKNG